MVSQRPLAVVTGASTGIGFELAKCCAANGFDILIAADEPQIETAAEQLRAAGATVQAVQVDLATQPGVEALYAAAQGRPIAALLANAGRGLGRAFLEQDFEEVRRVVDTNVTGTLYLVQLVARDMLARGDGKISITGSIAGFMPGTFKPCTTAPKPCWTPSRTLCVKLKDTGVSITCLMPGPTETAFFERADLMDTKVGTDKKQPAEEVAQVGFEAMMSGDAAVIAGWKNKLQATLANLLPNETLAAQHRKLAEPGTAW